MLRRWEEHHTEAADDGIVGAGSERQIVGRGDAKLRIFECTIVCRSPGGRHHLGNRIDPNDLAFGSDHGSDAQGWFSGARGHIQNCVSTANLPILDERMRHRRKHLLDNFTVLLPKRRGATPCVNNRWV
jgi:hypothetical protein